MALVACAIVPQGSRPIQVGGVPFWPQEAYQCGPAALAGVLGSSGVAVSPEQLTPRVYLPGRQGSVAIEMLAASRAFGRIAYLHSGGFATLASELRAGHPVLVLLRLNPSGPPAWHYAVVVGLDPAADTVILNSGLESGKRLGGRRFRAQWAASGNWGMLIPRPGALPATIELDSALRTIAAIETVLPEAAYQAYGAVLERWPRSSGALFGRGRAALGLGAYSEAVKLFRTVLRRQADSAAAANNLGVALSRAGRQAEARQVLESAIAARRSGDPWLQVLLDSLAEIGELPVQERQGDVR